MKTEVATFSSDAAAVAVGGYKEVENKSGARTKEVPTIATQATRKSKARAAQGPRRFQREPFKLQGNRQQEQLKDSGIHV